MICLHPTSGGAGLPIGNLTSQFWANVYMNRFDHFIKEDLRVLGYIRYVDDFVMFSNSKSQLQALKSEMTNYLATLRLIPHPNKTQLYHSIKGVQFLGFKVYPNKRKVKKESTHRYLRFLRKKLVLRSKGKLPPDQLEAGLNSWLGPIRFAQSKRLKINNVLYGWGSRTPAINPILERDLLTINNLQIIRSQKNRESLNDSPFGARSGT